MSEPTSKLCKRCGRHFERRAAMEADWEQRAFCSKACRKHGLRAVDRTLEEAILRLLRERGQGKSICPSEAARDVAPESWRPLMRQARYAVNRLAGRGLVRVTQGTKTVSAPDARGPIRVRLPQAGN